MKKKVILIGVLIAILIGVFIYYSRPTGRELTEAEKEKEITEILGRKANLSDKRPAGDKEYEGKYVRFAYPGDAQIYTYREKGTSGSQGSLDSFSYDLRKPKVVFNYTTVKGTSLDGNPSFRLRLLAERGYAKQNIEAGGVEGVLFKKDESQNSERSLFMFSEGYLSTFVVTGSDASALDRIMNLLLASLEFPQQN